MPDGPVRVKTTSACKFSLREEVTSYQVVGEVTAHQADDGYPV